MFTRTTNAVPVVYVIPAATNAVTGELLPERRETNYLPQITVTVAPPVARTFETLQTVNAAVPSPWQLPIQVGLGGLSALLASIAAAKTRRANQNQDLLNTVIAGVETAGLPAVKTSIANVASLKAQGALLDSHVQNVTG